MRLLTGLSGLTTCTFTVGLFGLALELTSSVLTM